MSDDTQNQDQQLPDFETALEQLERIIEQIEAGEIGLEESLTQYEHGMKLIRHCRGILDQAEQRIERLTQEADGTLTAEVDSSETDSSQAGDRASDEAEG